MAQRQIGACAGLPLSRPSGRTQRRFQQSLEPSGRQRGAIHEALHMTTAELDETLELLRRLDALGDETEPKRARQRDEARDGARGVDVAQHALYERAIHL